MEWQQSKLTNISQVRTGKWDANHATEDGAYKFFTCAYEALLCDTKRFDGECLILPGNGANVGEVFYYSGEFDAYQRTYVVSDIKVLPKFLFYHMKCFWRERNLYKQHGAATNYLKIGNFHEYEVSYPDTPEQKRIVAILDEVFADIEQVRAKTEQNLKNARELFESYLQQVFSQRGNGWFKKTLAEVSLDFGRGRSRHRPRNDESLYGGDYPLIQTGDVRNCEHIITNFSKTYNDKGLAQSKLWPKGTICITIAANIAETGILGFDSCFPDSVIGVVVNPEITTVNYVEYLLQSFKVILKEKGKGAAQDNINMGTFENMKFPFPPLETQNTIVDSLSKLMVYVQQLERIYLDKLAATDELKKTILQKAFSGELTKASDNKTKQGALA